MVGFWGRGGLAQEFFLHFDSAAWGFPSNGQGCFSSVGPASGIDISLSVWSFKGSVKGFWASSSTTNCLCHCTVWHPTTYQPYYHLISNLWHYISIIAALFADTHWQIVMGINPSSSPSQFLHPNNPAGPSLPCKITSYKSSLMGQHFTERCLDGWRGGKAMKSWGQSEISMATAVPRLSY